MSIDEKWMRRALHLAKRGEGNVHPNPMVGAVVVRGGLPVSEGWHRRYGQAHAEVEALQKARKRAKGATLYLTLEPCAHWGKTPPCVDMVIRSGVKRVVMAMRDPNPKAGGGISKLRKAGIHVTVGVLQAEARALNRVFCTWARFKRPYITLKAAASLDGRTATVTGESKWITGPVARKEGHRLRAEVDAVAVGANTVLHDNPSLTSHGLGRNPVRIIFAGRRAMPRSLKLFDTAAPTWVLNDTRGKPNLKRALTQLAERGITHMLVEGGAALQRSFWEAGVVDEVVWFVSPLWMGPAKRLKDAVRLKTPRVQRLGNDVLIQGYVHRTY